MVILLMCTARFSYTPLLHILSLTCSCCTLVLILFAEMQSLSLAATPSKPQPVYDLAYNPEEIKARLSGVPVYTVANKKNEFVLVAGEVRSPEWIPFT